MLVLFYLSEGSKSIWDDVLLFVLAAAIAAGMLALFMVPDYLFYQKRRNSIPTSDACHIQVLHPTSIPWLIRKRNLLNCVT